MAKITLTDLVSGYDIKTAHNANNTVLETFSDNCLSLDGTAPNSMGAQLDMGSNRIINVADAVNDQDAVTLSQLNTLAAGGSLIGYTQNAVNETITGDWTFSGASTFTGATTVPVATVTAHQASLSIAETQIVDGSILGRLAAAESVTGLWNFIAGLDVHTGMELRLYDEGNVDHADFFHNGTDFRINNTGTRWWSTRGVEAFLVDCDSSGGSPIPDIGPGAPDHAISLLSTTDGDHLQFTLYNNDGVNNPRAGMFLDDVNSKWGLSLSWSSSPNYDFVIQHSAQAYLSIEDVFNATGNVSGCKVADHAGTMQFVGFNTMPTFNFNASDTLEAQHCGKMTGKTNTTSYTLTGPADTDLDFPVGGVCVVANFGSSTAYTIQDTASCTMYVLDGASVTDIAGTASIASGGIATLYRYSASAIYIWGSGITA